jgi:predicted MPP superfamily phosphohydrolase
VNAVRFLTFLSVVAAIVVLLTAYAERRMVRDPAWREPWRSRAKWTLRGLGASIVVALASFRHVPHPWVTWTSWPGFVWLGTLFLLVAALAALEIPRLVARRAARTGDADADLSRRRFLARAAAGAAGTVAAGAAGLGVADAAGQVAVERVRVPIGRLPGEFEGFRIVQITDLHAGPTIGRPFVEEVVATANSLDADVVALTGDFVDGSVADLAHVVAPLAGLRARHGVHFVTGNHEYYSGAVEWCREFAAMGIRVLRNERVTITRDGPAGPASIDLAGIDDFTAASFGHGHGPDLARALAGRDPRRVVVLLAHQPRHLPEAVAAGVDLQVSGHTHGGQIWPFNFLTALANPVVAGLERHGGTWIYVSRGTGYWGPPMRVGIPAEVTLIELVRA